MPGIIKKKVEKCLQAIDQQTNSNASYMLKNSRTHIWIYVSNPEKNKMREDIAYLQYHDLIVVTYVTWDTEYLDITSTHKLNALYI